MPVPNLKHSFPRLHGFLAARLSPEGEMGLHLTMGVILMLSAAWLFGRIAQSVVAADAITVLDLAVANWLHARARASSGLTSMMLFVTHWHNTAGVLLMALLLGAWFYARKAHYWLLALVAIVPGGLILNVLLKYTFQRARPAFAEPLLTLATYSFPSGHTAGATMLYGVLASYLWVVTRHWGARAAIVGAACAMVALVALSRMYLGVHYLSDVLAAVAEGCTWLALCITAISTLRRRRLARPEQ